MPSEPVAAMAIAAGSRPRGSNPETRASKSESRGVGVKFTVEPISPKSMFFFTRVRWWSLKPVPVGTM